MHCLEPTSASPVPTHTLSETHVDVYWLTLLPAPLNSWQLVQDSGGWSARTGLTAPDCNLGATACLIHPTYVIMVFRPQSEEPSESGAVCNASWNDAEIVWSCCQCLFLQAQLQ